MAPNKARWQWYCYVACWYHANDHEIFHCTSDFLVHIGTSWWSRDIVLYICLLGTHWHKLNHVNRLAQVLTSVEKFVSGSQLLIHTGPWCPGLRNLVHALVGTEGAAWPAVCCRCPWIEALHLAASAQPENSPWGKFSSREHLHKSQQRNGCTVTTKLRGCYLILL